MSITAAAAIEVPDWARTLCEILDPKSTRGNLANRISSGEIQPSANLYYDLGISPTELASLALPINTSVIDTYGHPGPKRYVTTVDLQSCRKIVDLMNLIFDRLRA